MRKKSNATVLLSPEQLAKLRELAAAEQTSVSYLVRKALNPFLWPGGRPPSPQAAPEAILPGVAGEGVQQQADTQPKQG